MFNRIFSGPRKQPIRCDVGFMLNDTPAAMTQFLREIEPIINADEGAEWILDLRECRYMGPDAAAIVYSTVLMAKNQGQQCSVSLPDHPESLRAFCRFSGLDHIITGTASPDPNHPQNETSPLRQLQRADFAAPNPIISLVERHIELSRDADEYLRICFNEVSQNVEDHASSPIGAVTCARFMKKAQRVRVAIVDRGVGILTTLRRQYPDTKSAMHAFQRVVEGGYTAKSRQTNAGAGISILFEIIANLDGSIFAVSGDAVVVRTKQGTAFEQLRTVFPGTAVFFSLPVG